MAVGEESFLRVDVYDLVGSALDIGAERSTFPDYLRLFLFISLKLNDLLWLFRLIFTFDCHHFPLFLFCEYFRIFGFLNQVCSFRFIFDDFIIYFSFFGFFFDFHGDFLAFCMLAHFCLGNCTVNVILRSIYFFRVAKIITDVDIRFTVGHILNLRFIL